MTHEHETICILLLSLRLLEKEVLNSKQV